MGSPIGGAMQAGSAFGDFLSSIMRTVKGIGQEYQGLKGLSNLEQPQYQVDRNILQNKQLAGVYASQGFGNQFLNLGGDAIDRNLGSSINAYTSTGQGLNAVSGAQSNSNNAFQQLLMADAIQKGKNREVLMNANKDVAAENMKAFNYNQNLPWQLKYNQFSNMVNAGNLNQYRSSKDTGASGAAMGDAFSSFNYGGGMGGYGGYGGGGGQFGNGGAGGGW